jgi:hypothetical protein
VLIVAVAVATIVPAGAGAGEWAEQNPNLAPNPYNNIHNDTWMSDTYPNAGPEHVARVNVEVLSEFSFDDPITGAPTTFSQGECAAQTFDAAGNLYTICTGFPDPVTKEFQRSVITLSPQGELLAFLPFAAPFESIEMALSDFGGAGYFYLDDQFRVVGAFPDGHVRVYERQDSPVSTVDTFAAVRDINISDTGGPVPADIGSLYALGSAFNGYIWFSTSEAVMGTIAPDDTVQWIDLNVVAQAPCGDVQNIANSYAVNDNSAYVVTTYCQFRLDMDGGGTPSVGWVEPYDRGPQQKPGQVSFGSGSTPTFFEMGGRAFVAIIDNATQPNINVYRADDLLGGETRLFAQAKPFGDNSEVSDENSLILYPGSTPGSFRLFAENNWGNTTFLATIGFRTTSPGVGGIEVDPDGSITPLTVNGDVSVPSVVSKANLPSNAVYVYEKKPLGWYLTALDPGDLQTVIWSAQVGSGMIRWNNWYAGLALGPDGRFWIGTTIGLVVVEPVPGPARPPECAWVLDAEVFIELLVDAAEGNPVPAEYVEAIIAAFADSLSLIDAQLGGRHPGLIAQLIQDFETARAILEAASYDITVLTDEARAALRAIADANGDILGIIRAFYEADCIVEPTFTG